MNVDLPIRKGRAIHLVTPFLKLVYTTEELTVFLVGVAQWGCGPRYEPAVLTLQQAGT